MKTVTLLELRRYITKQHNSRKINLWNGMLGSESKGYIPCLLCHYGQYLGAKRGSASFHAFFGYAADNNHSFSIERGGSVHGLFHCREIPSETDALTYGQLKKKLISIKELKRRLA